MTVMILHQVMRQWLRMHADHSAEDSSRTTAITLHQVMRQWSGWLRITAVTWHQVMQHWSKMAHGSQ